MTPAEVRQRAFTIQTPIAGERVADLCRLLDRIGDDIKGNPHIPFTSLDRLHYASFVVVDIEPEAPYLLFEGNIDGPVADFVRDLIARAGPGVAEIYRHCVGCPVTHAEELVDYLLDHDIGISAFYVAWPGHTVPSIREEQLLHDRINWFLDQQLASSDIAAQRAAEVRRRIQEFVRSDPELAGARQPLPRPFLVRYGQLIAVALAAPVVIGLLKLAKAAVSPWSSRTKRFIARKALLVLAGLVASLAGVLRFHEIGDDRRLAARTPDWQSRYNQWADALGHVVEREDHQLQNHLASVTWVKPGRFRLGLLNAVFAVVTLLVELLANRGKLGNIGSIHFARWVVTTDERSLIFLSNFDGSWESYLDDFIDLASSWLNAVWSNTDNDIGFPSTRFVALGGAQQEQRFKAYARYSQFRSRVWYSAYPSLTVANIRTNMKIRRDLFTTLDDEDTDAWLRLL